MGRHSSRPEVVDEGLGLGTFGIRRVVDPDDEFATEEWLSWDHQDNGFTWREYPGSSGFTTARRDVAESIVAAYGLGWEDATQRATIPPLGS